MSESVFKMKIETDVKGDDLTVKWNANKGNKGFLKGSQTWENQKPEGLTEVRTAFKTALDNLGVPFELTNKNDYEVIVNYSGRSEAEITAVLVRCLVVIIELATTRIARFKLA